MTREEAIHRIKDHMVHHGIGGFPHILLAEAMKMAIAALREQEERSKAALTNADRIRAMSDEELAKFLDDCNSQGCVCPTRDCSEVCELCIAEWLKEPVKEDA